MPIKTSTLHKKIAKIDKEIKESDPNAKLIKRIEKLEEVAKSATIWKDKTSSTLTEIVSRINKISHRLGL